MIGRLFPTDIDGYDDLVARPGLDEGNFWTPSGVGINSEPLAPLLFKIKKNDGDAVGGFGLFARFRRMSILEAWQAFGDKNGAASLDEMRRRVGKYGGGRHGGLAT